MSENIGDKVFELFKSEKHKYYSCKYVSNELDIDFSKVKDVLWDDDRFRVAYFRTKDEKTTYTLSSNPIKLLEKICRLLSVAESLYNPNKKYIVD